ncbi:hypothetical protein HDU67_009621 [Dinochytrium kinnereticum]|nr:hypothetical protein HDU67_009621 [Dinochytrium kinnereticum]
MSIPDTQTALVFPAKGEKQVIRTDWPVPKLTPEDDSSVLIRVEAAGLNPVDYKIIDYGIFVETFPTILGSDGAGHIVQVGSKVTQFKVGDRVFFQAKIGDALTSTFQQYAKIPADKVFLLDERLSVEEGATWALAGATTAVAFKELGITGGKEDQGKFILIWGGTSSVGHFAIQAAQLLGLTVITTASKKNHPYLRTLNIPHILDYASPTILAEIRAIAPNLQYAFDTIGADSAAQCFRSLSTTYPSTIILIASGVAVLPWKEGKSEGAEELRSAKYVFGSIHLSGEAVKPFWEMAVRDWVPRGLIRPSPVRVLEGGLEAVVGGQEEHRGGRVSNVKMIVKP